MTDGQRREAMAPLIRAAGIAAQDMPPADRADVYDGIALVLGGLDEKLAASARQYANALRDAESLQLHFSDLFRKQP